MSFQPKVRIISTSTDIIDATDGTGLYDAISNPGGWGVPNPAKASVVGILSSVVPLNLASTTFNRLSDQDVANYLFQGGIQLGSGPDGVYTVEILLGFNTGNPLSSPGGSTVFTMNGADTIFALALGFTIDSLSLTSFYTIDRTQPLTGSGGSTTIPLPPVAGVTITVFLSSDTKALVSQAGLTCLNRDIANYAGDCGCCEGQDLDGLMKRYAEYLAMNNKFNIELDYPGADTLARRLATACLPPNSPCAPQGIQPNVPFTGNKPVIIQQPMNQNVQIGAEVAFAVAASGTPPLRYQWYKNGTLIPGAVGSTYILSNTQISDSAGFYVIVSNAFGSVQSNTVSLTVGSGLTAVTITTQPSSASSNLGSNVTFILVAAGSPTITYQWYKNSVAIPGATSASLPIIGVQPSDVASYYCIVTNPVNSVQSSPVTLSLGITAGWGWADVPPAIVTDLTSLQATGNFQSGGTITADYRTNLLPKFLIMYEPSTEPVKVTWFGDVNNNGHIGDPNNDLFGVPLIIGQYRAYVTIFKTLQTGTPIEFRTS